MSCVQLPVLSWQPDLAAHRDYLLGHEHVAHVLSRLKMRTRKSQQPPTNVDWREYCGAVDDQQGIASSTAHACISLIQYFERRASGRLVKLSRLFADHAAMRIGASVGNAPASLRTMLKAIVQCGVPPEKYWPYDSSRLEMEPDSFTYSFQRDFRSLTYLRLAQHQIEGEQILVQLKNFLAAGFPFVFGFPVCTALTSDAEIAFPSAVDGILGGQAVMAIGYDDQLRIRSDKGALLVRNSWGTSWGDGGYGWLPYSYVIRGLSTDYWTLLKPSWLKSGEFESPD